MSIKMFVLCAVAVVLLAPSADSQCTFQPGGNQCSTPWTVDKCVTGGVEALTTCLQGEIASAAAADSDRLDALEAKQMILMDMQDTIKNKLECVNRGGMLCAEDDMCYKVGGKKTFKNAKQGCENIEGGELIPALPSPPAVVEKCLKLKENNVVWLGVDPSPSGVECSGSKVLADFTGDDVVENCSDNSSRMVCKITI